jgi:hypothetical protein
MKTEITGVGTRDAGTSELSNLKTRTLETGITGGFPRKPICCFRKHGQQGVKRKIRG